jgi:hypothetical protein
MKEVQLPRRWLILDDAAISHKAFQNCHLHIATAADHIDCRRQLACM